MKSNSDKQSENLFYLKASSKGFVLVCSKYGCLVSDKNLSRAYERMMKNRAQIQENLIEEQLFLDHTEKAHWVYNSDDISGVRLVNFACKSAIVCISVVVILTAITFSSRDILRQLIPSNPVSVIESLVRPIHNELSTLTDEEQDNLRKKIQKSVKVLKPLFEEIKPIFD